MLVVERNDTHQNDAMTIDPETQEEINRLDQAVEDFASEMKALLALVGKRLPLDLQSIGEYLLQNLLDAGPGCLLQGVQRVPAPGRRQFIRCRWNQRARHP